MVEDDLLCKELIEFLFPFYPKEVVIVFSENKRGKKYYARNYKDLVRIAQLGSGFHGVFIRLNDYPIVNKVVFEFDGNDLFDVYNEVLKLVDYLRKNQILYIPVFSGKRGFHIYVFTSEFKINNRDDEKLVRTMITSVQKYIINQVDVKYIDKRLIGSPNHLIRLPNTKRENNRYAIFLPQNLHKYSLPEILEMSYQPTCYSIYEYRGKPLDLFEYFYNSDFTDVLDYDVEVATERSVSRYPSEKDKLYILLKDLVRPCILNHVFYYPNPDHPEPEHDMRTYFVSELMWAMFSQEEVEEIISKLGWDDYNPSITHYHVSKIFEKKLLPPSCRRLREQGYCLGKKCKYYPRFPYIWYYM